MTVWSHGAQTQRIDERLSLRWAGVSRSALRSLLLTDGGEIEPIRWLRVPSRALLGGVLCITSIAPVPSGNCPFGPVPKGSALRWAGYGPAGYPAGYCYSKGAEAARAIVLAAKITGPALQTSFQNAHQNTFKAANLDNRQIAPLGRCIRRITPKTEVSLSSREDAHGERGLVWH